MWEVTPLEPVWIVSGSIGDAACMGEIGVVSDETDTADNSKTISVTVSPLGIIHY